MKVFASSDIHFDHNIANQEIWSLIYDKCLQEPPDVLVICGDLAESLKHFDQALALFKDLNCHKLFVPGNHDLWNRIDLDRNASQKYNEDIPDLCLKNNWHFLPTNPIQIGEWTFVGSPFWYDYSLMPDGHPFTTEDFQRKSYKGRSWQDSKYVNFLEFKSDFDICKHFYHQLELDLKSVKTNKVFCASHFPCHHEIFNFTGENWAKEYFGAFMGSNSYQKLLEEHSVDILLSGHVHRTFDQTINDMRVILSPVGYLGEWPVKQAKEQISQTLKQLTI